MNLLKLKLSLPFVVLICIANKINADESPCGDWAEYQDKKCFKVFDKLELKTFDDSESYCQQNENYSNLVTIGSQEEEDFLSNLVFKTYKVVDNVWIGAKKFSNLAKFKWVDESNLTYTNWDVNKPSNLTDYNCVQMLPDSNPVGKWANEPCNKKNIVVCQKFQTWSITRLQKEFTDLNKKFNLLQENPVPIGFIYAQLPNQQDPKLIWPGLTWTDITSDYAGLFFRAEGGDSDKFGTIQTNNCPRINNVKYYYTMESDEEIYLEINSKSRPIVTSPPGSGNGYSLVFTTSGGEVRPRNQAMRIWKRTG